LQQWIANIYAAKLSATKGNKLIPKQMANVYRLNLDGNGMSFSLIRHQTSQ